MPWAAMKRSSVSKRSRGLPSSSLTTPSVITSDGSGSPGPFMATSPSDGSGRISVSRRSGAVARTRKRSLRGSSLTSRSAAARARRARRQPRARTRRSAVRSRRGQVRGRSSRARPPSPAAAAGRCRPRAPRRRGARASSAARSRFSASCSLPAARATAACRRSVCGVARRSSGETRPARSAVQRDLRERRAAGRRHELGPPLPERVVDERIHALRVPPSGGCYTRLQ